MHARVTKSEVTRDKIEDGIKRIKENVVPQVKKLEGFKGGYWLLDRTTGKGLGLTLFENEAALRATEDAAAKIRGEAPTGVKITGVERYEVVAQASPQPGITAARLTSVEAPSNKAEKLIAYTNDTVVPAAKKLPGFRGGYWVVDRQSGKGFGLTFFESQSALQASEDAAARLRSEVTQQADVKITGVERYDVFAQTIVEPAMAR